MLVLLRRFISSKPVLMGASLSVGYVVGHFAAEEYWMGVVESLKSSGPNSVTDVTLEVDTSGWRDPGVREPANC